MKSMCLTTITLLAFIANSCGVYENIFCNSCPLTLGSNCQAPQYTCKCVCFGGCNANDGTLVSNGVTMSLINIQNVAEVLQPCTSCFVFWYAWECKDVTTNMNINTCDHYNDYDKYKGNCLPVNSSLAAKTLHYLEKEVLVNMLYISNRFLPKNLWTWVDQAKARSKDELYMQQVKQQLFDSWKAFQVTGHGAIELGVFVYPNFLRNASFGRESRRINATAMFLKMNVDEYKQLVRYTRDSLGSYIVSPSPPIVVVDESGQPNYSPPRSHSPYPPPQREYAPPPPSRSTDNNKTSIDVGLGVVLALGWYYILAICLGGLILIVSVIAFFCCCCKAVCYC